MGNSYIKRAYLSGSNGETGLQAFQQNDVLPLSGCIDWVLLSTLR